ncbi:PTS sugar transporter subunit IIA [Vibrio algivorus]|uniref:PTS sugar transporter subunit IIA n=1 Tax=Vibrio algivorus TaxID=1667024 RepID=A0A557P507_9VIBR|nr:PTS sugar transporter subunit IIA [Vibrio algivorus]TVO35707.1 PTS sugar transporter subunit IIA [Vibrio algivorus]
MDISKVLKVNHIKLNMLANTKQEALEELTDLLVQSGSVSNKEEFLRDIWLREEQGPTGFENHIALPHGESAAVNQTTIAIGRTHHDISWETLSSTYVRCIILYAIKKECRDKDQIYSLRQVSTVLSYDEIIVKLLSANTSWEIIDIISDE